MKHFFFAILTLIVTCSKTHAANCTGRVDGAPCDSSICNQGICLPESEGICIDKRVDEFCGNCDTCLTYGNGRCYDVGKGGLLSCRNGMQYAKYWNEIQCASENEGNSCTFKEHIRNYGETSDGHSVFGEASSKCGKSVIDSVDQPPVCLDPYVAACSGKMEGEDCSYNSFLGETEECGGGWTSRAGTTTVLIGYKLCEKYATCWGDGTGSPAKCIKGDNVHYQCVLNQSGTCSSGSILSSVSALIFMIPLLFALL